MGARPPSNDREEPDVVAFGIATIDARLTDSELTFPASDEEVLDALGRDAVPYDAAGRTVPLETAVGETGTHRFDSRQELLNDLHDVFEERRANSGGYLDQFRALLPV